MTRTRVRRRAMTRTRRGDQRQSVDEYNENCILSMTIFRTTMNATDSSSVSVLSFTNNFD